MGLTISEEAYLEARQAADEGRIADAWAAGGDGYAAQAEVIIREWRDPQSITALIVNVNWERIVGPEVTEQLFEVVGLKHVDNYLKEILANHDKDLGYLLPDTKFIEQSYRESLEDNGLPPSSPSTHCTDGKRRLIEYFLSPLIQHGSEALRER